MVENLKSLKLMGEDLFSRIRRDEEGVTIVEYVVMIALVALAVIVAAPNIQAAVSQIFSELISGLGAL